MSVGEYEGFEVRGSAIEGLGVFATRVFEPGERILKFGHDDVMTPGRVIRPELGEKIDYVDQLADGVEVMLPAPGRHVNSSCDPSARVRWDRPAGDPHGKRECWAVAYRRVSPGDEVTVDYAIHTHGEESLPCRCGTSRCRGEIPGSVFSLGDAWLREYEPLMAGWFIRQWRVEYLAMCARLGIRARTPED